MNLQKELKNISLSLHPPGNGESAQNMAAQIIARQFSQRNSKDFLPKIQGLVDKFNQNIQATAGNKLQAQATETAEPSDASHFLNRLTYGSTSALLEQFDEIGWEAMLEQQLAPESIDTTELDAALAENFTTLSLTPEDIIQAQSVDLIIQVVTEFIAASLLRQTFSPAQLYERMVEFWSDHFNMNILDAPLFAFKSSDDRDAIRPHALGKFRDLLHADARSPAMLLYLDNYSNTKDGPNENYARELMELHTLGVDGGYTEEDVVTVAQAFTGWTINPFNYEFLFHFPLHDRHKKFVLGQKIRNTAKGGITDGEQVLDILADHPSTARFISTKLARRFVSDDPPTELIDELAQVFSDTDGDIKSLLRSLFSSAAFWASKEQKMKRPLDFLTSMVRRFGFVSGEDLFRYLFIRLQQMGQQPFYWHAPNGYPDTAAYWTNTAAMISRWSSGNDVSTFIPEENLVAILDGANTPNQIIQAVARALIDRPLGKDERRDLKRKIFAGQLPNQPITGNPIDYARIVATVLLGSRYFQLR